MDQDCIREIKQNFWREKMKENFTSLNVIVDKSGSMFTLLGSTLEGFNGFLEEQKKAPGEAVLTLCTFNTKYELVHDFVPLDKVSNLDETKYLPSGGTALLDAMGKTINEVGSKLAAMDENDRPSKVLFLIITDGQENSSLEFSKEKIKEMVEHQQTVYNWEFIFMGANIDAIAEGASLGITPDKAFQYSATPVGTRNLYKSVSDNTTKYRSSTTKHKFDISSK